MTVRRGRQEQVSPVNVATVTEINLAISSINRLFDGILGRGTVTDVPQFVKFKVVSTIPTAGDLDEGESIFYESGSTRRMYTKINGSIRYVNLT